MTSTEDNVLYREATADDKTAVIDIRRNVYDGMDYLEAYYDAFMAAETITCYVAIFKKQVVGFSAAMLVDGGRTYLPRVARVSPLVAGKGVYSALKNHAASPSGAEFEAFTASDDNPNILKESFKNAYQLVVTRVCVVIGPYHIFGRSRPRQNVIWTADVIQLKIIRYMIDADALKSLQIIKLTGSVRHIDRQAFTKYLTTPETSGYLFPDGKIIVDWLPFRLVPENVSTIFYGRGTNVRYFPRLQQKLQQTVLLP